MDNLASPVVVVAGAVVVVCTIEVVVVGIAVVVIAVAVAPCEVVVTCSTVVVDATTAAVLGLLEDWHPARTKLTANTTTNENHRPDSSDRILIPRLVDVTGPPDRHRD
jgi:hypothetical protein